MTLPDWLAPGFRLIERGRTWTADEIAAAAPIAPAGRWVVDARSTAQTLSALIAGERAGSDLVLRRVGTAEPTETPDADGFAVSLQTSGTTGIPKYIRHDFSALRGRLRGARDDSAVWLLAYDPAAYAGLQVTLTAAAAGATLVATPGEGAVGAARAAIDRGVTHISATPSLWRAALSAWGDGTPPLKVATLGGEAVDQPLLDRLRAAFPTAKLRHIYASTEAGALFAVADGRVGFPVLWLETGVDGVGLRIDDGILTVNSPRGGRDFAGRWFATGDRVEIRDDRVVFVGRDDGRVNVGGVKVFPEAVERRLSTVSGVVDVLVRAVPSPITGSLLTAVVARDPRSNEADVRAALRLAAAELDPAARPRVIEFVERLPLSETGKKTRGDGA